MVRAAVQNITLNILKSKRFKRELWSHKTSPKPQAGCLSDKFPFYQLFCESRSIFEGYLGQYWRNSAWFIVRPGFQDVKEVTYCYSFKDCTKLAELLDNQYDLLIYIDDIFKLNRNRISQILSNTLLSYLIIPNLIAPLTSSTKV